MPVTQAEYKKLLERERGRKAGPQTGRDDAVRRANIAAGFGNSTAERFLGGPYKLAPKSGGSRKSGSKGGDGGSGGGGVPTPKPRPDDPSPPRDPSLMWQSPPSAPSPQRDPSLMWESPPPDPSPVRDPSLMWQGATAGGSGGGQPFGFSNTVLGNAAGVGDAAAAAARVPGAAAHVFPGFHPASIFQTAPPDPNEPWWRAMFRG